MTTFLLLKYVHILLFVFWLGTDMGTYYASRFVINSKLSTPQRATAMQILMGCDLGPRIAMPLSIPTGIHLGSLLGVVKISTTALSLVWGISILWLVLVLAVHFGKKESLKKKLKNIDFWIRPLMVLVVGGFALYSMANPEYILADWVNYKLLIVCGLILFGLGIRYHLEKFTPAFVNLMQGTDMAESNTIIKQRMDKCLPYVYGIWIGLLVNGALGVHLI